MDALFLRVFRAGVLCLALAFPLAGSAIAEEPAPLRMALIPYLSPNVLVSLFQPLARHFEHDVGRKIELYSAPSIRVHVERILKPDYDIVFTAPHMGRLSQVDAGYVPIGGFQRPLTGVISVRKNSAITKIEQLRGKTVAINDRLVLNSILVLNELKKRGISANDLVIVPAVTQNSALLSVAVGDVDAAITVNFALGQIPKESQAELRTLFQTEEDPTMPGTLILVHPKMPLDQRQRLQASLMRFAGTDDGRKFMSASSYKDVAAIVPAHLRNLDVFLPELRRLLAAAPGN